MALSIVPPGHAQQRTSGLATCSTILLQFGVTYVAPASIVPIGYQCYATCKGLTYIRLLLQMDGDKVMVRVAPLDYRLDVPGKFCILILREAQLAQALLFDRTLRDLSYHDRRELVEDHAMQMCRLLDQQSEAVSSSSGSIPDLQEEEPSQPPISLQVISKPEAAMFIYDRSEVRLSIEAIRQAYASMKERLQNQRLSTRHLPALLLQAALLTVVQQMREEREPLRYMELRFQEADLRRLLAFRHRIRPHLNVTPLYAKGRQGQIVGCIVRIGVPLSLAA